LYVRYLRAERREVAAIQGIALMVFFNIIYYLSFLFIGIELNHSYLTYKG
jgi:hypothetical protein